MSTALQIQNAWEIKILKNSAIKNISEKYFFYDITEDSEKEVSSFYYKTEINFFQILIGRANNFGVSKALQYRYDVQFAYFREADPDGRNWQTLRDFFDTLFDTVRSELGNTWNSTVDFWVPQDGVSEITQTDLDTTRVWRGIYSFAGFKEISL